MTLPVRKLTRRAFLDIVAQQALCNRPTLDNTWDLTADVIARNVPGDLVETGVFAGAQPAVMARVCDVTRSTKRVHLFDSFVGIPMAGEHDGNFTDCVGVPPPGKIGALETTGVSACSLAGVQANMRRWGIDPTRLRYYEGWFQNTVPPAAGKIGPIALLRLDGDLYESTRVCLENLYPLLSPGGYCIIDDYALTGCRRAVDEYLATIGEIPTVIAVDGGAGVSYWRKT
jgi:hypothetical protein